MTKKFEDFELEVDGVEVEYRVYEPTLEDQREANKVRNEAFHDALKSKAPLRAHLNSILKASGNWDEEQEKQVEDLTDKIDAAEKRLAEGGFELGETPVLKTRNSTEDTGYNLALEIRGWRAQRRSLLTEVSRLDNNTAEGQADNMSFNYLVCACLVYNTTDKKDQKVYEKLEDYLNNSNDDVAFQAASKLANLMYSVGDDSEKALAENQFLTEFGFVDDKLRLVNGDGHLIDVDGRLINEDGRFVDLEGNFVDRDGNSITEEGTYKVECKGFFQGGKKVKSKSEQEAEVKEKAAKAQAKADKKIADKSGDSQ